jgi:NAD(P)-dependent dehydrogenase (short-subunit alcohol dehydrogenase family)
MNDLQGKVALVTGAGGERGIGRAIAMRLAAAGADVVVTDVTESPASATGWQGLRQVVTEIERLGRRAAGIVADVGEAAEVQRMVDEAVGRLGRIDILVNNAAARAAGDRVPVVDLDESDWDRVQRTNVRGTFLCCRAVARHMLARAGGCQGGRIINIASTAGKTGIARYGAYCASKFAVIGLTQSLAQELAPKGVTVNAICPSLVATERVDDIAAALTPAASTGGDHRQALINDAVGRAPLGRLADVQDVASLAAFLASPQAGYLTGLAISVAGGTHMH